MSSVPNDIVLYIWPSKWGLFSLDPSCLAVVIVLLQTIPGKFRIVECNNPDLSPAGQLPFLVCGQGAMTGFRPIVTYIVEKKLHEINTIISDRSLDRGEKSRVTAWTAHLETQLGDILYFSLFSNLRNWTELTHPALVSIFPVPQRYYVPGRVRESYRPRLEAAGLWNLQKVEKPEPKLVEKMSSRIEKQDNSQKFRDAFSREKILDKARTLFDLYARLLGEKKFLLSDLPTSLDALLAAHILLLLEPSYPDQSLQSLLKTSYTTLGAHAHRVYSLALSSADSPLQMTSSPQSFPWRSLIYWPFNSSHRYHGSKKAESSAEELYDRRMRWGFFGITLGSFAVYMLLASTKRVEARQNVGEEFEEDG